MHMYTTNTVDEGETTSAVVPRSKMEIVLPSAAGIDLDTFAKFNNVIGENNITGLAAVEKKRRGRPGTNYHVP